MGEEGKTLLNVMARPAPHQPVKTISNPKVQNAHKRSEYARTAARSKPDTSCPARIIAAKEGQILSPRSIGVYLNVRNMWFALPSSCISKGDMSPFLHTKNFSNFTIQSESEGFAQS
jgi:hypothetical protein